MFEQNWTKRMVFAEEKDLNTGFTNLVILDSKRKVG